MLHAYKQHLCPMHLCIRSMHNSGSTLAACSGAPVETNQYSVTEYEQDIMKGNTQMPAIYFMYDFSPVSVDIRVARGSLAHFLVRTCAVVGGVFAVTGAHAFLDHLISFPESVCSDCLPAMWCVSVCVCVNPSDHSQTHVSIISCLGMPCAWGYICCDSSACHLTVPALAAAVPTRDVNTGLYLCSPACACASAQLKEHCSHAC